MSAFAMRACMPRRAGRMPLEEGWRHPRPPRPRRLRPRVEHAAEAGEGVAVVARYPAVAAQRVA